MIIMDGVDKKIISCLQEDGRASLSEMGQKLGLSHVSVRNRLKNLYEGLVNVSAGLNAEQLGLRIAIINAEVETPERLRELTDLFSKCPRTFFIATTTGAYNVMMIMIAEDADTLNAILEACSIRARKGIRRSEATVGEAPIIPKYLPIKIVPDKKMEIAPCEINCGKCLRYKNKKCLGCPSTKYYRGPL
ncbi:MAG: Lrp/AsnC family transcriptional regulator [Candidatus Hadarchaeum sp.]|uniref:Lrp/AsnC family transcriptional regulator n=1 Tax=Candidatus Hadarchaeum sp. TaxID=2883567 RepID=UPI003D0BF020